MLAMKRSLISKYKLAQEKLYLEMNPGETDFEEIVGQSSALRHVLKLGRTELLQRLDGVASR